MAAGLKRVRFTKKQIPQGAHGLAASLTAGPGETPDQSARRYLAELFGAPAVTALSLTNTPASAPPDLSFIEEKKEPLTNTVNVSYQQTFKKLPVYGARVGVQLTPKNAFLGVDGDVASPDGVDPVPTLSADEASSKVGEILGSALAGELPAPTLALRFDAVEDAWKLAYVFEGVVVRSAKPGSDAEREGPEERHYRFFLDAHSGKEIVRAPLFRHAGPVQATGKDLTGRTHTFGATEVSPNAFILRDPNKKIRTLTLDFKKWNGFPTPLPGSDVKSQTQSFDLADHAPAVAAHAHAGKVLDFFRETFKRDGIDGNGMEVVSAVNCVETTFNSNKVWRNAAWFRFEHAAFPAEVHRGLMIYGQVRRADGKLLSIAEGLDVVAHELTHGVTDYTADLEYVTQSGALNESYSDIIGMIIANQPKPIAQWTWGMGGVLTPNGKPIRDLEDPTRHGQPAHMNDFVGLAPGELPGEDNDSGHVHTNSGIHNKAAHTLLTSGVFDWQEVARMFYLTLTTPGRLSPTSDFDDSREGMLASCEALFADEDPVVLDEKLAAIRAAFASVGIGTP